MPAFDKLEKREEIDERDGYRDCNPTNCAKSRPSSYSLSALPLASESKLR